MNKSQAFIMNNSHFILQAAESSNFSAVIYHGSKKRLQSHEIIPLLFPQLDWEVQGPDLLLLGLWSRSLHQLGFRLAFICSRDLSLRGPINEGNDWYFERTFVVTQLKFPRMGSPGRELTLGQGGDRSAGFDSSAETRQRFWMYQGGHESDPPRKDKDEGRARKSGFILSMLRCKPHQGERKKERSRAPSRPTCSQLWCLAEQ